jgi:hypothetical protein
MFTCEGVVVLRPVSDVIELERRQDRLGREVWAVPTATGDPAAADQTRQAAMERPLVVMRPGGRLVDDAGEVMSALPRERMATGPNWDRIIRAIQENESGHRTGDQVVVRPGGSLDLVPSGQASEELSRIPKERMASMARVADETEIRTFDPTGKEQWRFIDDAVLPGYAFVMRPISTAFQFFTFRWAGGRWFVSPLVPAFDTLTGHETHVITLNVGSDSVPVVCKAPNDFDHRNLTEVRGTAAKFAVYHSLRAAGHIPYSA